MDLLISGMDFLLNIAIIAVPAYFLYSLISKETDGQQRFISTIFTGFVFTILTLMYLLYWTFYENPSRLIRLSFLALLTPSETVTYTCGDNLELVTHAKVVLLEMGEAFVNSELGVESSVELIRDKIPLSFHYLGSADLPLDLDIQDAYLLHDYPDYSREAIVEKYSSEDINYHNTDYVIEILVSAQDVNSKELASIARCIKNNEIKISESIDNPRNHFWGDTYKYVPIRGIYAIGNIDYYAEKYDGVHIRFLSNDAKTFMCNDRDSILIYGGRYGAIVPYGANQMDRIEIVVRTDGTIAPSSLLTEDEIGIFNAKDLSTCKDGDGTAITELYKERAGRLKML